MLKSQVDCRHSSNLEILNLQFQVAVKSNFCMKFDLRMMAAFSWQHGTVNVRIVSQKFCLLLIYEVFHFVDNYYDKKKLVPKFYWFICLNKVSFTNMPYHLVFLVSSRVILLLENNGEVRITIFFFSPEDIFQEKSQANSLHPVLRNRAQFLHGWTFLRTRQIQYFHISTFPQDVLYSWHKTWVKPFTVKCFQPEQLRDSNNPNATKCYKML